MLWRPGPSGLEVAAVWRPDVGNWSLPKGKLEGGEPLLVAACREVEEETGVPPIPQAWLCRAEYVLPNRDGDVHKTVDFWSMRTDKPEAEFEGNEEIGSRQWIPLGEAFVRLTRPRDQLALRSFSALPRVTSTVVLVAPAETDSRDGSPALTAPLSERGRDQAVRLAGLVSLYQPDKALTATARASVQTVEPVASSLGLTVLSETAFDASSHGRNPERSVARLRRLAEESSGAVVGAEEDVIADAVAILSDEDGIGVPDVSTRPGEAWVLAFSGSRLAGAERL